MRNYIATAYTSEGPQRELIEAKNYDEAFEKAYNFAYKITGYGEKSYLQMVTCHFVKKQKKQKKNRFKKGCVK